MAKEGGGTRNYNPGSRAWTKRMDEYNGLLATGMYDRSRSAFDKSGGFYITHKDHDQITNHKEDKSDTAVEILASKGYRVYLDAEKSTISDNGKKKDGRIEKLSMDIKTINSAGENSIQRVVKKAALQGAKAVILYQNTPDMDEKYVRKKIYDEKEGLIYVAPKSTIAQIDWIIVVGSNGHVHRHNIAKERWRRGL